MTRERLQIFSVEELLEIAEKSRITLGNELDKESIIDQLIDSYEDEKEERENISNLAIQVEAKKFSVSRDEEIAINDPDELILPESYHETKLVIMMRDPSWVFAYWEIEKKVYEKFYVKGHSRLMLRVLEMDSNEFDSEGIIDFFDIPISLKDSRRYINLPNEDACYCAEIIIADEEGEKILARSAVRETSREYIRNSLRGSTENQTDLLIQLSGFSTDVGIFPGETVKEIIPQRILPINENEIEEKE